ncbi:MAG: ribosome small subunit-dependent GTPase A [Clostridia bacterium]|nr:ribosome small subunit-dependent GTPase A [Clostridia bacterium]
MKIDNGLIVKGIGGFYHVKTAADLYLCKPKGIFRQQKIKPLPGDRVEISIDDNKDGIITAIKERKNYLNRPALANIDKIFITISMGKPKPVLLLADKMTILANYIGATPIIVINKIDLSPNQAKEIEEIYTKSGIDAFCVCAKTGEGIEQFDKRLDGICVLTGNTGVGKSSIINRLIPNLSIDTNEISKALGRGVHTTRETTLYDIKDGYIADTPGFSTLTLDKNSDIQSSELANYFSDFLPFLDDCKFSNCSHIQENDDCAIYKAFCNKQIQSSRYDSYKNIYTQLKSANKFNK